MTFLSLALIGASLAGPTAAASADPSANGHGNLVIDGALRTFSFHARKSADGDVHGGFELKTRHLGIRVHGEIDCLRLEGCASRPKGCTSS